MSDSWRDEIIGQAEVPPDSLRDNPRNWRIHGARQRETMSDILTATGWVQPILVNERTGVVVDGHMRLDLARRRGEPTVPVAYVNLDDETEARVLASLNPLGALVTEDEATKAELRARVHAERATLRNLIGLGAPDDIETEGFETADAGLTRDHTQTILDEEGADDDMTLGGYEDDYASEAIRLVSFVMTVEEYDDCLAALEAIGNREQLETNADVILWLLRTYQPEPATEETES